MPHHFQSSQSVRAMHTTLRRWKLEVQVLVRAPFHVFVAETERHLSCKQAHVSAKLTGGSISDALHSVIAALLFVKETESGRNRLRSPFFQSGRRRPRSGTIFIRTADALVRLPNSCARQRAEPAVCNTALPSASLGRTSTFIGYERANELTWFGTKTRPGQHRGIRPL
jgi:hypothetical protein